MERHTGHTVVMIFYETRSGMTLVEKRTRDSSLPNSLLFPAGGVEQHELEDIEQAFLREVYEEIGITPISFKDLKPEETIFGETGKRLHPFLITQWGGHIPPVILDSGAPLYWKPLDEIAESNIESMRKLCQLVKFHIEQIYG